MNSHASLCTSGASPLPRLTASRSHLHRSLVVSLPEAFGITPAESIAQAVKLVLLWKPFTKRRDQ